MRILITGGCGFIGSNLAVAIRSAGHEVLCLDNLSRHGSDLLRDRVREHGCRFVHGDVRNPEDLDRIEDFADVLIDCSAEPSVMAGSHGDAARYVLSVNLEGSLRCFEWARKRSVPILFLSTSRVYSYADLNACPFHETDTRFELAGEAAGVTRQGVSPAMPLGGARSLYGATKLCAELILKEYAVQYDLPVLINRCGVVAGPWQLGKADQGVFTFWMAAHFFRRPLNYIGFGGQGKQVRDLLHVDDLSELVIRQLAMMGRAGMWRGEVYGVGGGPAGSLSLQETTELCASVSGNRIVIGSCKETRSADVIWFVTDIRETERLFDWTPRRSPARILEDVYHWLAQNQAICGRIFR